MVDFRKHLSKEARQRHAEADENYLRDVIKFRNLANRHLISSVKYYMSQMKEPWKHEFSEPTYDAVFWHVIVPELIKRIEEGIVK